MGSSNQTPLTRNFFPNFLKSTSFCSNHEVKESFFHRAPDFVENSACLYTHTLLYLLLVVTLYSCVTSLGIVIPSLLQKRKGTLLEARNVPEILATGAEKCTEILFSRHLVFFRVGLCLSLLHSYKMTFCEIRIAGSGGGGGMLLYPCLYTCMYVPCVLSFTLIFQWTFCHLILRPRVRRVQRALIQL